MPHNFTNSSMLQSCEHDGNCLTITFQNGISYKYEGVPKDEYHALINAESAGKHFGSAIRGKYKHSKLEKEQ